LLRGMAARSAALAYAQGRSTRDETKRSARGGEESRLRRPAWNVPTWERSDGLRTRTARRSGAVAVSMAAICLIPMQISYSYVDLGLNSGRNLLLIGVALAIISHMRTTLGLDKGSEPPTVARPRARSSQTPAPDRHTPLDDTVMDNTIDERSSRDESPSVEAGDDSSALAREQSAATATITEERPVGPGSPRAP
jgi:hypothetical protein